MGCGAFVEPASVSDRGDSLDRAESIEGKKQRTRSICAISAVQARSFSRGRPWNGAAISQPLQRPILQTTGAHWNLDAREYAREAYIVLILRGCLLSPRLFLSCWPCLDSFLLSPPHAQSLALFVNCGEGSEAFSRQSTKSRLRASP